MFERFTGRARRVVVLAQEEARLLNHDVIGTEHLLLGLTASPGDAVAKRVLSAVGVELESVRQDVEDIVGPGALPPGGHIPFTPRARRVLELALREALQLDHRHIGTEHILLAIMGEGEGVAAQILVRSGHDLSELRRRVLEEVSGGTSELTIDDGDDGGDGPTMRPTIRGDRTTASAPFAPARVSADPAGRVTPGLLAVMFVLVGVVAVGIDRPPTTLGRIGLGVMLVGLVAAVLAAAARPATLSPRLARRVGRGLGPTSAWSRNSFAVAVLAFGLASGILLIDALLS